MFMSMSGSTTAASSNAPSVETGAGGSEGGEGGFGGCEGWDVGGVAMIVKSLRKSERVRG